MVAKGYVICFTLTRQVFNDLLGSRRELWQFNCLRKVQNHQLPDIPCVISSAPYRPPLVLMITHPQHPQVPVLCTVSNEQLWELVKHMETQSFERGDFVFRKGETGHSFYIVANGTFRIFDGENLCRLHHSPLPLLLMQI